MIGCGSNPPVDGVAIKDESGALVTDADQKALMFLDTFDISGQLGTPTNNEISEFVLNCIDSPTHSLLNLPFSSHELDGALSKLNCNATGLDLVHNKMLKRHSFVNRAHLCHLFNCLLMGKYVLAEWKNAVVIPILKSGKSANKVYWYRPISLTSCLGKIMERLINNRLSWFLESKNSIPARQAGFHMAGALRITSLSSTIRLKNDLVPVGPCTPYSLIYPRPMTLRGSLAF